MMERMARGIWSIREADWPSAGPWEEASPFFQDMVRAEARAALEAIRMPSEAMLSVVHPSWRPELAANYRAMIDNILSEAAS